MTNVLESINANITSVLSDLEPERQVIEVNFSDVFDTAWTVKNKGLDSQTVSFSNEFMVNKLAFFQMVKIINHYMHKKLAPRYLWNYPNVLEENMANHVENYKTKRELTTKRAHNNVRLMVHGETVTSFLSTNYVDYSNLDLMRQFEAVCAGNNLVPKDYSFTMDEFGDRLSFIPIFDFFDEDYTIYGPGVMLSNSQNKTIGLSLAPLVKSTACDNSILSWYQIYHRHDAGIVDFAKQHIDTLPYLIELAVATYHNYMNAVHTQLVVEELPTIFMFIRKKFNVPTMSINKLIEGMSSERTDIEYTLFNLVSGLTYMAQYLPPSREDEAARVLSYAGRLLMLSEEFDTVGFNELSGGRF